MTPLLDLWHFKLTWANNHQYDPALWDSLLAELANPPARLPDELLLQIKSLYSQVLLSQQRARALQSALDSIENPATPLADKQFALTQALALQAEDDPRLLAWREKLATWTPEKIKLYQDHLNFFLEKRLYGLPTPRALLWLQEEHAQLGQIAPESELLEKLARQEERLSDFDARFRQIESLDRDTLADMIRVLEKKIQQGLLQEETNGKAQNNEERLTLARQSYARLCLAIAQNYLSQATGLSELGQAEQFHPLLDLRRIEDELKLAILSLQPDRAKDFGNLDFAKVKPSRMALSPEERPTFDLTLEVCNRHLLLLEEARKIWEAPERPLLQLYELRRYWNHADLQALIEQEEAIHHQSAYQMTEDLLYTPLAFLNPNAVESVESALRQSPLLQSERRTQIGEWIGQISKLKAELPAAQARLADLRARMEELENLLRSGNLSQAKARLEEIQAAELEKLGDANLKERLEQARQRHSRLQAEAEALMQVQRHYQLALNNLDFIGGWQSVLIACEERYPEQERGLPLIWQQGRKYYLHALARLLYLEATPENRDFKLAQAAEAWNYLALLGIDETFPDPTLQILIQNA